MDIRAFRQDLQQKSNEAKKTYFTEDKINVTFSGIKSDAEASRYKELAEVLQVQVDILEAVLNEAKKRPVKKTKKSAKPAKPAKPAKLAKKDYDQDGKIESGTAEWEGSRDNAIKKAIAKKEVSEAVVSKALRLAKKYPERAEQAVDIKDLKLDMLQGKMDRTALATDMAYNLYKKYGHAGDEAAADAALTRAARHDGANRIASEKYKAHEGDLKKILKQIKNAKKK